MRKQNQRGMNYLEPENQKQYRNNIRREKQKATAERMFRLVRNVVIAGAVIGVSIHFFVIWFFTEVPVKAAVPIEPTLITEIIADITRPLGRHEVGFEMQSEYALLINISNGRILFDHQADVQIFPASVTKIMTVLVGLENSTMDEEVTVIADFDALWLAGAMQAGFHFGETRSMSEIIHGVMLPSGAEATMALANHIAGSYEDFVTMMNEKAQALGMNDTHFVTATGLHDDNHYTTANDIAILLQYALANPEFRTIFTTAEYQLSRPNAMGNTMRSTLHQFAPTTEFEGGQIIGGRTGFTFPAGRCMASLATDGTDEFILITFGIPDPYFTNTAAHVLDALVIYEYFLDALSY